MTRDLDTMDLTIEPCRIAGLGALSPGSVALPGAPASAPPALQRALLFMVLGCATVVRHRFVDTTMLPGFSCAGLPAPW